MHTRRSDTHATTTSDLDLEFLFRGRQPHPATMGYARTRAPRPPADDDLARERAAVIEDAGGSTRPADPLHARSPAVG